MLFLIKAYTQLRVAQAQLNLIFVARTVGDYLQKIHLIFESADEGNFCDY